MGKKWLVSGSWDKTIIIWNIEDDKNLLMRKICPGVQVRCFQITKFREQIVIGAFEGKLSFWNFGDVSEFSKKCKCFLFF
jgi:WD40 repeat protein